MFFDPQAGRTDPNADDPRRARGRLGLESVVCSLGPVLDISSGGMRVITSQVPKKDLGITIAGAGIKVQVHASVAWSKRLGLFKHEIGLIFVDVSSETKQQIATIALANRNRRAI